MDAVEGAAREFEFIKTHWDRQILERNEMNQQCVAKRNDFDRVCLPKQTLCQFKCHLRRHQSNYGGWWRNVRTCCEL